MNRFFKTFAVVVLIFGVSVGIAYAVDTYAPRSPATDPGAGSKHTFWQSGVVDCNDVKYFKSGVTNGDIIQLVKVPVNTIVKSIYLRTTRAAIISGTSSEVGDGADIDGYIGNANTYPCPFIDLSKVTSGISIWTAMHQSTMMISGVSRGGGISGGGDYTSNLGPYFQNGVSVYKSPDTIDMTVYVNAQLAASGVTPKFEWMIECVKLPAH